MAATLLEASLCDGHKPQLHSLTCVSEPNKKRQHMPFAKSKIFPISCLRRILTDVVAQHKSNVSLVSLNRVVTDVVEPQHETTRVSSVPTDGDIVNVVEPHETMVSPAPTNRVIIDYAEPHKSKVSHVPIDRVAADVVESHETMVCPVPTDRVVINVVEPQENMVSPVPLNTSAIDNVEPKPCFYNIDRSQLTQLFQQKNSNQLAEYDGILGLANALRTNLVTGIIGLDDEHISHRRESFGTNTYPRPPTKSFYHFAWEALKDSTVLILLVCAALSLGFGIKEHGPKNGWFDGGIIFVAALLVMVVSAVTSFWKKRHFVKFSEASNNILVDVVRNGTRQQVLIFDIVVGDVVYLKIGAEVPADGLFIDGHSLQVNEPITMSRSQNVEVDERNPFLSSGAMVINGSGRMLVTSVGMDTSWGKMISWDSEEQTPLQAQLNKLTSAIGKFVLAVSFLVLVVLLVRYFTGNTKDENGNTEFNSGQTKVDDDAIKSVGRIVAVVVTIIVVAIPKSLFFTVSIILASTKKGMSAYNAKVRNLSTCETICSITTICTDTTGILTFNQLKVTKFWLGHVSMEERVPTSIADNVLELLYQGVGLNTTGTVYRSPSGFEFEFFGSPIEKAILSWGVLELNMDVEELRHNYTRLHVEPFNSTKKISGISMRKMADNTINVHWKGDAETVLLMCSYYYDFSGNTRVVDDDERSKFVQTIQGMVANGLRCIAFAHKQVQEDANENGEAQVNIEDKYLTLLGLVGIKDVCRPGVKNAVEACQYAGVNIKMITSDNIFTAKEIATTCGILRPNQDTNSGVVVEGEEFRNYNEMERREKVERICVMARSSPFDKLLMVQCLKQKGHVVAVTGDGINDVPALKEADIALSMGIQGAKVAKESSDIVIEDNNFNSVATILKWGRCVYNNIQNFIQFQLTVCVSALVINSVAAVLDKEVPLTVVQLLLVNLIMDTLGVMALTMEKPRKELMEKPPMDRTMPLITNIMWSNLLAQTFYQTVVLLAFQFRGESIFGVDGIVNDTLIFNTFVLRQIFDEFNARNLEMKNVFEGIHKSKLFLVIIGITIVLQVMMVEFSKKFLDTERLNWWQWGVCIGFAALSWPINWLVRCIPVPLKPFFNYLK